MTECGQYIDIDMQMVYILIYTPICINCISTDAIRILENGNGTFTEIL